MRALKGLVIGLGVVILVLFGLVIWGIARLGQEPDAGFDRATVEMPAGCRLAEAGADGAGGLLLRLDGPAERGCQQLLIVDRASGALKGRIELREAP